MTNDLRVILPSNEEIHGWIMDRKHWIVVFGEDDHDWVDRLDEWIGVYPTFPTLISLRFLVTIVPKVALDKERLLAFCKTLHLAPFDEMFLAGDEDILLLSSDDEDFKPMMLYVGDLAGIP